MSAPIRALLVALSLASTADAQGPAPGFRLFGRLNSTETHLVDTEGTVVHTWTSAHVPGTGVYLDADGTLLRAIFSGIPTQLLGAGGAVERLAMDGTVLWRYDYDGPGVMSHHDIEPMPNGNILLIAWEEKSLNEAVLAGRNPQLMLPPVFLPDHVVEVRPTGPTSGEIVWEWHVWDHLVQEFDPERENYGTIADHPELLDINYPPLIAPGGDWNHCNSIDYDPVYDRIMLSARDQNEIWILDHSTTTAEAAGHTGGNSGKGGDLIYRWGNPAAYGRGDASHQQLVGQHGAIFIPEGYAGAGNVLLFNNGTDNPGSSEVIELVLPDDMNGHFSLAPGATFGPAGPIWSYAAPDFGSNFVSNAERLPNGNTLICSGVQGRIFEVTPGGQVVWEKHETPFVFHAHYVGRTLWADASTLSIASGGTVRFDLIAGSQFAGNPRWLLGSVTGTSPGIELDGLPLPINFDGYTATTITRPNLFPLGGFAGSLEATGRGVATFSLPAGILPTALAGIEFDHAFAVLDPTWSAVVHTSNAARFVLDF